MDKKYLYILYNNLFKYLDYRDSPKPNLLSKDEFIENISSSSMIIIESGKICIILTLPNGKYSVLGADGKKKLKDISSTNKFEEILYICDINYVNTRTATSLNTVKKIIADLKSSYKNIWFQVRPYNTFELVIPVCSEIVPHRLISKKEADEYLNTEYKNKSTIPQICEFEPILTWMGIRSGSFVEIERLSVSVMSHKIIRYTVDGY
uniref:RNA polymerase subunit H/Rpb5 C-terminal domain-containing protein n=1 Tax=viral metagenome TaxID=1070528 RepID=A0A6C0LKK1_9ZZZZ